MQQVREKDCYLLLLEEINRIGDWQNQQPNQGCKTLRMDLQEN